MTKQKLGFRQISSNPKGALEAIFVPQLDADVPEMLQQPHNQAYDLNVYHINDLHQSLTSQSNGQRVDNMALIASYVQQARSRESEHQVNLFVSAGDEHVGSVFDELLEPELDQTAISASYHCLSAAGLDASVIGNHEYDKETLAAQRSIHEDAQFVVLSANLQGSSFVEYQHQSAIGVAKGLRVGLLGLSPTSDFYMHTQSDPQLHVTQPQDCVNQHVRDLDDYVDCWLVLSHLGYCAPGEYQRHPSDFSDLELAALMAKLSDKPSVIVGGHSHSELNVSSLEPINQIAQSMVVQTGAFGQNLGHARCQFGPEYSLVQSAQLLSISDLNAMPTLKIKAEAFSAQYISPLEARLSTKLNIEIADPINNSKLGQSAVATSRYCGECPLANFMNQAIASQSQYFAQGAVDIAVFNASAINGFKLNSPIRYADIYKMMPYADQIILLELNGSQLWQLLQSNAQRLIHSHELLSNGGKLDPNLLLERGFLHFSSKLRYQVSQASDGQHNRLVSASFEGREIDKKRHYRLAISSYLAYGKGFWNGESSIGGRQLKGFDLATLARQNGIETGLLYRSEIISYLKNTAHNQIDQQSGAILDQRFSFVGN